MSATCPPARRQAWLAGGCGGAVRCAAKNRRRACPARWLRCCISALVLRLRARCKLGSRGRADARQTPCTPVVCAWRYVGCARLRSGLASASFCRTLHAVSRHRRQCTHTIQADHDQRLPRDINAPGSTYEGPRPRKVPAHPARYTPALGSTLFMFIDVSVDIGRQLHRDEERAAKSPRARFPDPRPFLNIVHEGGGV